MAAAAQLVTVPPVAIELTTDLDIKTASAYEVQAAPSTPKVPAPTKTSTEAKVRAYFADIPVMVAIAECESDFHQLDPSTGYIHRGRVNPNDLGVMQINETYHGATAARLDLNLYSLEGNLAYARYLYNTQGTQPWSASRACWASKNLALNQ